MEVINGVKLIVLHNKKKGKEKTFSKGQTRGPGPQCPSSGSGPNYTPKIKATSSLYSEARWLQNEKGHKVLQYKTKITCTHKQWEQQQASILKIVSEYDQEITQSQTAHNLMAP